MILRLDHLFEVFFSLYMAGGYRPMLPSIGVNVHRTFFVFHNDGRLCHVLKFKAA